MPSTLISLATLALVATPTVATSYSLLHHIDESNFFQNFSFFSEQDPTAGYVKYLDYEAASAAGLAKTKSGNIYLGADSTNTYSSGGRPSTRVESNFEFTQGLLVADLAHMPGSACGIWPAFWTYGADWPTNGEIDIIEGVNNQTANDMTLHTGSQCSISKNNMTGTIYSSDCSENDGSTGCVVDGPTGTFGDAFNDVGGGVYAMEWTSEHIKVWFFPRAEIPSSITSGNPESDTFGTPLAYFQGSCDIDTAFHAQQIVFNIDFCGGWAAGGFGTDANQCPMSVSGDTTASCEAFVGSNPSAFTEAYWEIISVKVYEQSNGNSASSSSVAPTSATTSSLRPSTAYRATTSSIRHTSSSSATTSFSESQLVAAMAHTVLPPSSSSHIISNSHVTPSSHLIPSSSAVRSSSPRASPNTTPCPSKSTVTVTSILTPSSAIASSSTVRVTSAFANPSVNAVNTSSSKETTTTLVTTSYVDICPTGYTTKVVTQTVTYCPADATTSGVSLAFTTTSKYCATGCGPGPTTVVVSTPIESSSTISSISTTASSVSATLSSTSAIWSSTAITSSGTSTAETLPVVLVASSPPTVLATSSKPGFNWKTVPGNVGTSNVRVPAAASSSTVLASYRPLGSQVPQSGKGSVTSTAVSPQNTNAASTTSSSVFAIVAVVATLVLFM